ncbi:hypothetical protein [uncultured Chryseobacterium sp.]|uniref:hypothetical protein n=1 Tax=uncultured Chryseobacterium sp. TaxID=259322 RepID=UPI0025D8FF4C|nr:hypothetical protein [uncultured Chryseobacterium sp.]
MHLIIDLSSIKRYQTPDSRNTGVSNIKETGGKLIVSAWTSLDFVAGYFPNKNNMVSKYSAKTH